MLPPSIGRPASMTVFRNPNPPVAVRIRTKGVSKSMSVRKLMTPPDALPQRVVAFDRMTSSDPTDQGFRRSNEVRPSGSVRGSPSSSTRIPREVPAFERSPAPLAPKPRIVIRTSWDPERDWASSRGRPAGPHPGRSPGRTKCPPASGRSPPGADRRWSMTSGTT